MFQGLDNVDWNSIKNMFRTAERIPELLHGILLPDTNQLHLLLEIQRLICDYNGDRVPAMPMLPTLPFLFELLNYERFEPKAYLLNFLGLVIMEGSEYLDEKTSNDFMTQSIDLIKSQESLYVTFLLHDSQAIRFGAISVLNYLSVSDETLQAVIEMAESDKSSDVRSFVSWYLVEFVLRKNSISDILYQRVIALLHQQFSTELNAKYKIQRAYGLLKLQKQNVDKTIIEAIVKYLSNNDVIKWVYNARTEWMLHDDLWHTHWDIPVSAYIIFELLYECGVDVGFKALFGILKARQHDRFWYSRELSLQDKNALVCVALLDLLFEKSYYAMRQTHFSKHQDEYRFHLERGRKTISVWDVPKISQLTKHEQYEFLIWLLEVENFWEYPTDLLEWYGLPASRDKLRQFVVKHAPK